MKQPFAGMVSATLLVGLTAFSCQAQPTINSGGVISAAAYGGFHAIAPGSWIEIYGTDLASDSRGWEISDFNGVNAPTSLDGTSVTIGGQAAFIDFISANQVNALVPSNVGLGEQSLVVTAPKGISKPYSVTVNLLQPGLLAPANFKIGGKQNVVAFFPDNTTYVLPPGSVPGLTSRRAMPGEVITLYGTGFGPVTPDIPAGQLVESANTLALPSQFSFGSAAAQSSYAGLSNGSVGLYQFDLTVPNIQGSDTVPLTFNVGGVSGTQTLFIAIQSNSAPQLASLTLSPTTIASGGNAEGTVTLSTSAPAGGIVVMLSSSSAPVSVPTTVTIPAGATSATFTISTSQVSSSQSVTVTATLDGNSVQVGLMLTAPAALPQFNEIVVSATYSFNNLTYAGEVVLSAIPGPTYSIATVSGISSGSNLFGVAFNTITVAGDTFTLTGVILGADSVLENASGNYGITAGSATVTLSPSGSPAVGNVTGSFTVTSALGNMTGTISGSYLAN